MTSEQLELEAQRANDAGVAGQREVDAHVARAEALSVRASIIRTTTATLARVVPQIAVETEWLHHLRAWRLTLANEMVTLPPRIRTDHELGSQQTLKLSLMAIDVGFVADTGYELENMRLGTLMRESGFVEGPNIANQVHGQLPWYGSMPEVEEGLKTLEAQRADARARLADAMRDDAERERLAVERAARNAMPERKRCDDGSQYDRYPDGREAELQ